MPDPIHYIANHCLPPHLFDTSRQTAEAKLWCSRFCSATFPFVPSLGEHARIFVHPSTTHSPQAPAVLCLPLVALFSFQHVTGQPDRHHSTSRAGRPPAALNLSRSQVPSYAIKYSASPFAINPSHCTDNLTDRPGRIKSSLSIIQPPLVFLECRRHQTSAPRSPL
ncbi:hypothetical protein IWX90DRAFT_87741 [Phyllosticta citrichinensis]|uniref:C2H2-type domain-containing protein n=1 Tax=Phyllosticta citrichinensis TaxID=1130410 RepID=A0ABR1XFH3_9PEZI